jgi:hypothetical protein
VRWLEKASRSEFATGGKPEDVASHGDFRMMVPIAAHGGEQATSGQGGVVRRLRLLSGLVMFAYIAVHLGNHALGIFSLALAESGLRLEMVFWRTTIATLFLYGAAMMHFSLALWTLYDRREWRLP